MELNSLHPDFHYGWCREEASAAESELEDNPSPILYKACNCTAGPKLFIEGGLRLKRFSSI